MVNSIREVGIALTRADVDASRREGSRERVIQIPAEILDAMVAHAVQGLPNEACGLLAGRDGRADRFIPMRNADESRTTYRLEAKEQFDAFNDLEARGWELTGIFHSHTHTEAYPSETDRRQAFYPEAYYVLLSLADRSSPDLRAFTIRDGVVEEQDVSIV
jgi:proteasome lid subunit RPN8/RPN11